MRRPSFQFYPADWLGNSSLRRCSHAARGAWADVLCVLHDSDEYGLVRYSLRELAHACGAPLKLLKELADKRVLKGIDYGTCEPLVYVPRSGRRDGEPVVLVPAQAGPIWYSSRMVRDEYVRSVRGADSRFDGSDPPPKASPKGGLGEGKGGAPKRTPKPAQSDGSSSSSSSSATQRKKARAKTEHGDEADESRFEGVHGSPTPAGIACRVMRAKGLASVNPGDPRLLALLEQGATLPEFEGLATEAVDKGKGFAWLLVTLANRRAEAAALPRGTSPVRPAESAWERGQRETVEAFTGGLVSKHHHHDERTIDVAARRMD